jgi:hypothetical protein
MGPFIKGCTIQIEFTVDEDITNWEIKAKLYDSSNNSLVLKTTGAGGSDDEIEKTTNHKFLLKVPYGTTQKWEDKATLEIKIDTGIDVGGKAEVLPGYKGTIQLEDSDLDWDID